MVAAAQHNLDRALLAAAVDHHTDHRAARPVLPPRAVGPPPRPAVDADRGRLFVAVDGGLYALAADTGESLWQADFDGLPSHGLFVSDTRVAVGSTDRSLYGFDIGTGQLLWRYETGGMLRAYPVGTTNTIYVGAGDGWLHAVDAADG